MIDSDMCANLDSFHTEMLRLPSSQDGLKQHQQGGQGGGGFHNPFDMFSQFFGTYRSCVLVKSLR